MWIVRGSSVVLLATLPVVASCGNTKTGESASRVATSALEPGNEATGWEVKDWGRPTPRSGPAVAYDAARGQLVVFGGSGPLGATAETWLWDGARWTLIPTEAGGPSPRTGYAVAYDDARQKVVLFGGSLSGTKFDDTWEWDGEKWTDVTPADPLERPPARNAHALAYDSTRGKVVLFGGIGSTSALADTWEWDGEKWTNVTPSNPEDRPSPRSSHALAYDAARDRVVLFGGFVSGRVQDVWEWNGSKWTELSPATRPPARTDHALVYDGARQTVVLFGGIGTGRLGDTWEWDGENWTQRSSSGPGARNAYGLAYDATRHKVVLFGGISNSGYRNDLWELDGTGWVEVNEPVLPAPRRGHVLGYDPKRGKTLLFGGSDIEEIDGSESGSSATYFDDTWEWNGSEWTRLAPATSPPPRYKPALAYDSSRERFVLFGGSVFPNSLNDTWVWNGETATWQDVTPGSSSDSPPPRHFPAIAYDAARDNVVLFGGKGDAALLSDTWVWDGTRWFDVTPTDPLHSPPARTKHVLAYDDERHRVVLFGGEGQGVLFDDVWVWDGTKWTDVTPSDPGPDARKYASLAYVGGGTLLLFGGGTGDELFGETFLGDTWEWNGSAWTPSSSPSSPRPRGDTALAFDSARGKVVLFGGFTNYTHFDDTWEFSVTAACVEDWDCTIGVCVNGTCQDLCANVTCEAPDTCHESACDPYTGQCVYTPIADGGACDDDLDGGDGLDASIDADDETEAGAGGDASDGTDAGAGDEGDAGEEAGTDAGADAGELGWMLRQFGPPQQRGYHALAYDAARGKTLLFGGLQLNYTTSGYDAADTWVWDGTRWDHVTPTSLGESPSPRLSHALAYDSDRERVVLFGGTSLQSGYLGDTWEWDGVKWMNVTPPIPAESPPVRSDHALAYDSQRKRVVLFGGYAGGSLGDTWEWDGTKWTEVTPEAPSESPGVRYRHALAYDPVRARVVFFGESGAEVSYGDTWEWDGVRWTNVTPTEPEKNPPNRWYSALTYDAARQRVVLFGGRGHIGGSVTDLNDVWEWDGQGWNELTPADPQASPPPREAPGLAYDTARQKVVLFGGVGEDGYNDTWEWDGTSWVEVKPEVPTARYGHGLVYDAKGGKTLLFGGLFRSDLGDTWTWDGEKWTELAPASSPSPRYSPALAYDEGRERVVLFGGTDGTELADTWEWNGETETWQEVTPTDPNDSPPPRYYAAMAYDAARGTVLLFGGRGNPIYLADTWVWNGVTWEEVTPPDPADSPPGRHGHALAYDAERQRVVLFGGYSFGTRLDDTWEWDGTKWHDVTPAGAALRPSAREFASLVDKGDGKVLLFGGMNSSYEYPNDTWEWDGTSWMPLNTSVSPVGRMETSLAFDSARRRVVLFGGYSDLFESETWEFGVLGSCTLDAECETGVCIGGTCQDLCANAVCTPPDACHEGACDPYTGQCVYTPIADAGACGDESDAGTDAGDETDGGVDDDAGSGVDAGTDAGDEIDAGDGADAGSGGSDETDGGVGEDAGDDADTDDDVCNEASDGTPCGDGDECTIGLCRAGVCEQTHRLDGTRCEGGICIAGICRLDRERIGPDDDEGGSADGVRDDDAAGGPGRDGSHADSESDEGGGLCSVSGGSANSSKAPPMVLALALSAALLRRRDARRHALAHTHVPMTPRPPSPPS